MKYLCNDFDNIFNVPECFWSLDNTHGDCRCSKIYFDVFLDFCSYRLVICKDWYVQKVKNIMANIESDIIYEKHYYRRYTEEDIKDIQCFIIEFIIFKYFKTPIEDSIISNVEYRHLFQTKPSLFVFQIPICERPWITKTIEIFQFVQFYHFHHHDFLFQKKGHQHYNIHITYTILMNHLKDVLKSHLKSSKWNKIRPLLNKITNTLPSEYDAVALVSEILYEYNFLKINSKL